MKSPNSFYRFALVVLAGASGAACDGQTGTGESAQSRELAECSVSIPADNTALQLQRTVDAVLAGTLDPCSGAVSSSDTIRELMRLDADEESVQVIFRVVPKAKTPGTVPASAVPQRNLLQGANLQRNLLDGAPSQGNLVDRLVPDGTVPDHAAALQRQLLQ
jgi:hypothetical protein